MQRKLNILYFSFRFFLFLICIISEKFFGSWDYSTQSYLFDIDPPKNVFDSFIRKALSPFLKWDAFYFLHIAQHGYTHEKFYAFYPFLPFLIRVGGNGFRI
jgi:phosphatidylinositol glycan class V